MLRVRSIVNRRYGEVHGVGRSILLYLAKAGSVVNAVSIVSVARLPDRVA